MNAVTWLKSKSEVGKTSYGTMAEKKHPWTENCKQQQDKIHSHSAKNAVKAIGMTLSEGFLVTNLIH